MKYLLLGNGEVAGGADFSGADCVVQFNLCRHRRVVPAAVRRRYVFLSNTGTPAEEGVAFLLGEAGLRGDRIVLARNPLFYRLKRLRFRKGEKAWGDYAVPDAPRRLRGWDVRAVGFFSTVWLEGRMRRAGMPGWQMPSTGMIAYDWVSRRMREGDELRLAGFSWEGWEGHPWAIEKSMMMGG